MQNKKTRLPNNQSKLTLGLKVNQTWPINLYKA